MVSLQKRMYQLKNRKGSFDKGIYFSIPLDIVSKTHKNNARFVWKNLTKDGGAMLSGGLDLSGHVENTSTNFLKYFSDGFKNGFNSYFL